MRLWTVILPIALLWSCSTTPRFTNDHGFSRPETSPVDAGQIAYHGNGDAYLPKVGTETTLDLKARIVKEESALGKLFGDLDRKLVQTSSLAWAGHSPTFQWVCEYRLQPNDTSWAYDYTFSLAKAPTGITVEPFDTTGENLRSTLPFEVFRGTVQGIPFRVVGTRDFVWHRVTGWSSERGSTNETWWSIHDPEQKFQVVSDENVVLAELVGPGRGAYGRFSFRVFGTTPEPLLAPVKVLLAMVASLNRFLEDAEQYRNGRSPDARRSPPVGMKDWPLF